MRLLPVVILMVFAVIAMKTISILFDDAPVVTGVTEAFAADEPAVAEDAPADDSEKTNLEKGIEAKKKEKAEMLANRKAEDFDELLQRREDKILKQSYTDSEVQLLLSLRKRRDELDKRERKIELQAQLIKAAEIQLDAKIEKLKALERRVKAKLGQANQEETDRFASLVKTYETMKPKEAANILSILELNIMEKIARAMSTKKFAPILAKMDMKSARALTIRLAQPPQELVEEKMVPKKAIAKPDELPKLSLE